MQLFEKPKIFFCILFAFLESILHLEYFEKNEPPSLSSYWTPKDILRKCKKGLVSENPSVVNVLMKSAKVTLSHLFVILSQIELEKVNFSQIKYFWTAC